MERRAFLLSVGLSLLSMYLVWQYVSGKDAEYKSAYGVLFPMVVASRDILQYETIRPTDVEVIRVPRAMVPPGMLSDPKDVYDSIASIPISKGEQILDNKIISKNVYSGLDTQIAIGKRAMSIPVNVKSSLGFMIRPGNRVDLAAHFEYKNLGTSISEVKVFMQDILVLASGRTIQPEAPRGVDQALFKRAISNKDITDVPSREDVHETLNFAKTDTNYQTITIEVTPEQAQQINYVLTVFSDSIICMLRHSDDRQLERRTTMNLKNVMGPDSYMNRGPKLAPPRAVLEPRFRDYVGGAEIPIMK